MRTHARHLERLKTLVCIVPLLAVGACGDDSPGSDATLVDAGSDATLVDAGPDGSTGHTCADLLVTGTVFELDPDGPDTQIHVKAAFDGDGVWLVWNRPDGNNDFDVWAQRLGCDGAPS